MPKRLLTFLGVIVGLMALTILVGREGARHISPPVDAIATTTIEQATPPITSTTSTIKTNALVVRAVDGDTLDVRIDGDPKEERIRLLGINTPETVDPRKPVECFGKEASGHMHEMVDGKRIRLDEDLQADNVDKYQRLLRNVVLEDGTDVNAEMVRDGYAYAYLSFPLNPRRKAELKKLENDARLAQRGLWSPTTCAGKK